MKLFIKYFVVAFICFTVMLTSGMWIYDNVKTEPINAKDKDLISTPTPEEEQDETPKNKFEEMFEKSDRINILLLGMEDSRTDTIMFASFDPDKKYVDIISIPRDTFYERKANHSLDKKKINAVYGDEGIEGVKTAISDVLVGTPIHYYVKISYKGVEKIVDSLGGVEVDIPMNMKYDDPYDKPPLHINLKKGKQVLKGKKAIEFLRFRKNNNGTGYPNGDLGRIQAQQQFIKSALDKTLSFKLPVVANTVLKYVDTDVSITQAGKLAVKAVGMSSSDLKTHSLPGEPTYSHKVSYYLHDIQDTAKLIESIYNRE